jgi:hypothetical protein
MNPFDPRSLSAFLHEGTVVLNFHLGIADGITLLSRRGSETDFTALAEDEPPPVIDSRPKLDPGRPEIRRYRAIFRYSGHECRVLSNEVVLTLA